MSYIPGSTVLGDDGVPTYNPGATGAQTAATVKVMEETAAGGNQYAKDWVAANATNEYARAVSAGEVPKYITAPADQQKFAELMTAINDKGFTSLTGEDQAAFNWLRSTGTATDGGEPIGGKFTGVYAWDPASMTGDLPPGADRIAKDLVTPHAGDTTPYVPPKAERAINLRPGGGGYIYADDGSAVPQSEMDRLGLRIATSSSMPPATGGGGSRPGPSATDNYPPQVVSAGPSDHATVDFAPPPVDDTPAPAPSSRKGLLIGGGIVAGIGLLALATSNSRPRRR